MQVEQPRRLERIASAYPKPSPRRPQDSQQQHKRNKKKTPAQTGPLLHTDSHSSDDNDCRSDTSCTRHSNPTSPISPVCNTSTRLHKGPTTGRKPQSAKLSRHRDHLHRSVLHENASMSQTQTQTQTQTQAQSVQAQAPRSSQECQRAPSLSPGAKRALGRPRQNEHSHSHHQRHSHSQADPSETLRATLSPRVTTTVTMTTAASTRTTAGAVSNRAGSASEPDDVGLCKSPSSDSKRARVQNGSGKRSTAASDTNRGSASTMQQQSQQEVVDISSDESDHGASNEGQDLDNERDLQKMLADMQGASSHDQDNGHSSVTGPSASGAGSRRGSQTLYHYHHQCQHHQHRQQELSNGNGYRTPTASNGSNPRSSHQTHTRNFSSPSLLDSFTSPEPMLSPIQSYFGSDPNSPASTFSLPSHDQYPRLTIDPSATMDGYHGFATHPWSEQSTTPSRALSHRWTRRLSQSDAYPNVANSANSHSSTTRPRPASSVYASSTTDRPWQVTSDIDSAQALDVDDSVQGALDDETMDNTYSDHESTYNHPLDHNRNLRTSDYGDDMDHSPSLRYSHRASTVDAEDDEEDNDSHMIGSDYEVEDDEDNDDGDDGDDDDDGMGEGYDVEGVLSTNYLQEQLLFSSASSRTNHTSGSQSAQTIESDAALARRLQDEEYSDLLRERRRITDFNADLSSPYSPSTRYSRSRRRFNLEAEGVGPYHGPWRPGSREDRYPRSWGPFSDALRRSEERRRHFEAFDRTLERTSSTEAEGARSGTSYSQGNQTPSSRLSRTEHSRSGETTSTNILGLVSERRSALVGLLAANGGRYDRRGTRERSRSPLPPSAFTAASEMERRDRDRERLWTIMAEIMERRLNSQGNRAMDMMWGNPEDYVNDDQIDSSYEGLLRLSEQIGDAKPKGVSTQVLRRMDKHIVSWRRMKQRNVTLTRPSESTLRHSRSLSSATSPTAMGSTRSLGSMQSTRPILPSFSSSSESTSTSTSTLASSRDSMLYSGSLSGSQSVSTLSSPRSSAGWTVLANDRSDPSMEEASDENCSICLQVYELSDQLRPLPCRHAFHVECIDTWLKSNAQCPICRQEVTATLVDTML